MGWHTKPKPPRLAYRKRWRQERRPARAGANSVDLRPSNPFYPADEVGTSSKPGRDLHVTGSLCAPCQDPPFDRPEDLWWRNRERTTVRARVLSSRICFTLRGLRRSRHATSAESTPLSTSRRTTRSTGRRVTSSATTSPPTVGGYRSRYALLLVLPRHRRPVGKLRGSPRHIRRSGPVVRSLLNERP